MSIIDEIKKIKAEYDGFMAYLNAVESGADISFSRLNSTSQIQVHVTKKNAVDSGHFINQQFIPTLVATLNHNKEALIKWMRELEREKLLSVTEKCKEDAHEWIKIIDEMANSLDERTSPFDSD